MPHLAQDRLALVRKLYESSELTIAEIAILADVSESAIYQRARRERWATTRRPGVTPRKAKLRPPLPPTPALMALAGEAEAGADGPSARDGSTEGGSAQAPAGHGAAPALPDVDRAETARRLWLAVDRHIADLDARDAPDDMIRTARDLAVLARTLKTLVGIEQGMARQRVSAPYIDEGPEDIDEFRNEIARRFEALCAQDD